MHCIYFDVPLPFIIYSAFFIISSKSATDRVMGFPLVEDACAVAVHTSVICEDCILQRRDIEGTCKSDTNASIQRTPSLTLAFELPWHNENSNKNNNNNNII